ncbi:MAG: nuclear transport factor 2 family protein [Sciscionella sp.]
MTITDWAHATDIPTDTLPATITGYLVAHRARDLDTAIDYYTGDSTVTDEGRTYTGPEAISDWLASSASEFAYTIEFTGAARLDECHYDAVHHLEGNFPGGVVDLHFRFTLSDGKITSLVIEP